MDRGEIEQKLLALPKELATTELRSAKLKGEIKQLQQQTAQRENTIVTSRSAKDWGSNDSERKANREAAFLADRELNRLFVECYAAEQDLAENEVEVSRLKTTLHVYRTILETQAAFALAERSPLANGLLADLGI